MVPFVVWTKSDIHVEEIHFDPQLWDDILFKILSLFCKDFLVRELLLRSIQ
jgi:hypothetical protein